MIGIVLPWGTIGLVLVLLCGLAACAMPSGSAGLASSEMHTSGSGMSSNSTGSGGGGSMR
jgi:hypothetical protein